MQGYYAFYLRGEKAALERVLDALGVSSPNSADTAFGVTLMVPADFLQAPADAQLHIAVKQESSVNINGMMQEAKSLHKQFPQVEMLYLETYLNNECFANVLYGSAGDPECEETVTTKEDTAFPIDYEEGTVTFTDDGEEEILHFDPNSADPEEAIYDLLLDWCDRHGASPFAYEFYGDSINSILDPWILEEPMAGLADTSRLQQIF